MTYLNMDILPVLRKAKLLAAHEATEQELDRLQDMMGAAQLRIKTPEGRTTMRESLARYNELEEINNQRLVEIMAIEVPRRRRSAATFTSTTSRATFREILSAMKLSHRPTTSMISHPLFLIHSYPIISLEYSRSSKLLCDIRKQHIADTQRAPWGTALGVSCRDQRPIVWYLETILPKAFSLVSHSLASHYSLSLHIQDISSVCLLTSSAHHGRPRLLGVLAHAEVV